ncbi:RNA polymerase sigma factor [Engelhardtia mirabilis]|uniref:RNA polymerase sigma factor n=1 Tax=Engelhardtia mirabilis TaxID=2528011 RepID=A0A518BM64_9BACT|nr:RNA polymerase sigma factor [Planctomycetes bacterium Pla133]QDV02379.1 RNA polymerase sigma factor [Planctomycetes bacterium Pla86]
MAAAAGDVPARIDAIYRADSRRVLATLIRRLGDFDLAEEALSDAFAEALRRWPSEGIPAYPRAWLVAAGRFRALDALRRRARRDASLAVVAERIERDAEGYRSTSAPGLAALDGELVDDRLRLVFTCCHPALAPEGQVALTLREVCGLATEEIASAFLTAPSTIAQRIVRAKTKIRDEQLPYEVPGPAEWPARLAGVLQVVYLVFNEGHHASSGATLVRADLCAEAIRLGRLVLGLIDGGDETPSAARRDLGLEPRRSSGATEAAGLLALMLLNDARRSARLDVAGDLVTLEFQDRALWDRGQIAEGVALVERALANRNFGAYTLQAAIAAVHAESPSAEATDWPQIVGLYDLLLRVAPSPVVELNRAVAVAMRDGPAVGLALVDALFAGAAGRELERYLPAHATRADLCRRLGRGDEAAAAYRRALALARQAPERRYFERRLAELETA